MSSMTASLEKELVDYLNTHADLASMVGKFYFHSVDKGILMPWGIVTNFGGNRITYSQVYKLYVGTIGIYIDSANKFDAFNVAQTVVNALDEYRGNLGSVQDLYMTCEIPRDLDTLGGAYRSLVTVHVSYKFIKIRPN